MIWEIVELQQAGNEGGGDVGENVSAETAITQQPYDTDKVQGDNLPGGEAIIIS